MNKNKEELETLKEDELVKVTGGSEEAKGNVSISKPTFEGHVDNRDDDSSM